MATSRHLVVLVPTVLINISKALTTSYYKGLLRLLNWGKCLLLRTYILDQTPRVHLILDGIVPVVSPKVSRLDSRFGTEVSPVPHLVRTVQHTHKKVFFFSPSPPYEVLEVRYL